MIHPAFTSLLPFLGKTWRGEFANSTPEKTVVDISRWELALNGQVIRILHSINDGDYGGETIIIWDAASQGLIYYYFTTAGFYTTGQITTEAGRIITREQVKGSRDGTTEVKAINELLPDGRMHVKSEYLQNGTWIPGRNMFYSEDSHAEVKFKPG